MNKWATENKAVVLTGQTATGKTALALSLAREKNGVLISADSRQAYRYLDVISGKDITEKNFVPKETISEYTIGYYTIAGVKVWLYDMGTPDAYLSSYDWARCARHVMETGIEEGALPIVVGGTFHYIRTLLYGLDGTAGPQPELRHSLARLSVSDLQARLQQADSETYKRMNRSDQWNPRRLVRALERAEGAKGESLPGIYNQWDISAVALLWNNADALRARIDARVEKRLKEGAVAEVEMLMHMGYGLHSPGMKGLGYHELFEHLQGKFSLDEAVKLWKTHEQQYAKRQKTFIRHDTHFSRLDPADTTLDTLVNVV